MDFYSVGERDMDVRHLQYRFVTVYILEGTVSHSSYHNGQYNNIVVKCLPITVSILGVNIVLKVSQVLFNS